MDGSRPGGRTLLGFNQPYQQQQQRQIPKYPGTASPATNTPGNATPVVADQLKEQPAPAAAAAAPVPTSAAPPTSVLNVGEEATAPAAGAAPSDAPAPSLLAPPEAATGTTSEGGQSSTGVATPTTGQATPLMASSGSSSGEHMVTPSAGSGSPSAAGSATGSSDAPSRPFSSSGSPNPPQGSQRGKRKPPTPIGPEDINDAQSQEDTSAVPAAPVEDVVAPTTPAVSSPPPPPSNRPPSMPSTPSRFSRRGYTLDDEDAGSHGPRDLMAESSRWAAARAAAATVGSHSADPSSTSAGDITDEAPLPPGLALTSDSPSMRSRRGVLLKSSSPALSGRRNRRRGSTSAGESVTDTQSNSAFSHDAASSGSRAVPPVPALPDRVDDNDDGAAPSVFGEALEGGSDVDLDHDDVGSVVFQAGSALSHGSFSDDDDAGSGKVQGSQRAARDDDNDDDDDGSSDDDSDDGDDDNDTSNDASNDADASAATSPAFTRGNAPNVTTLHAPLFAAAARSTSPSSSFASSSAAQPPPIPARRVRPDAPVPAPAAVPPPAPTTAEDAERRRKMLELNRKLQADGAEWEKHILSADWEELEVARYLNEFGRHVHAVRGTQYLDAASFSQPAFPTRFEWTTFPDDGHSPPRFNAPGYALAWATAFLSYISPSRMTDLQQVHLADEEELEEEMLPNASTTSAAALDEFRWGAVKASSERLYLSAMPLYEMLGSKLRRVWRWESKLHSLAYMGAYTFLWWRGLLVSSTIFGVIMLVLSLKTFPPRPDALREVLFRQKRREEEARREGSSSEPTPAPAAASSASASPSPSQLPRSKYSLAVEATRKYGMQTSVIAGALADGHEKAKNFALWRSPRATWRLLFWLSLFFFISLALKPVHLMRLPGAALGVAFFIIGPIAEYKPQWLGVEWSNPLDWVFAGVPNDAQYSMEILRTRAAQGKPLISDTALLMRPDVVAPAVPSVTAVASAVAADNRVDWSRWADTVMKGKSLAITGSEILSGSRALNLPRLPVSEITPATSTSSALLTNLTKGLNRGIKAIEDHRNTSSASGVSARQRQTGGKAGSVSQGTVQDDTAGHTADRDGTYWCLHDGICGHLVVTPQSVVFRSLFAKRPRGRRGQVTTTAAASASRTSLQSDASGSGSGGEDQPLIDPSTGDLTVPESTLTDPSSLPKVKVLREIPLSRIVGLKKIKDASSSPPRSAVKEASNWTKVGKTFNQLLQGEGGLQIIIEKPRNRRRKTGGSISSTEGGDGDSEDEGTELDFLHLIKRDEAFNRLLALTPRQWVKVY